MAWRRGITSISKICRNWNRNSLGSRNFLVIFISCNFFFVIFFILMICLTFNHNFFFTFLELFPANHTFLKRWFLPSYCKIWKSYFLLRLIKAKVQESSHLSIFSISNRVEIKIFASFFQKNAQVKIPRRQFAKFILEKVTAGRKPIHSMSTLQQSMLFDARFSLISASLFLQAPSRSRNHHENHENYRLCSHFS